MNNPIFFDSAAQAGAKESAGDSAAETRLDTAAADTTPTDAPPSDTPSDTADGPKPRRRRRSRRSRKKPEGHIAPDEESCGAAPAAGEGAEAEAPRKSRRRLAREAKPPKPVVVPLAPIREDAEIDEQYLRAFTTEEIMEMPLLQFVGKIIMVESDRMLHQALKVLHTQTLLGFDTETRPIFKKGKIPAPALLQLATDKDVYLFQLNKLDEKEALTEILAARHILKTGVSVRDDLKGLKEHFEFREHGFVDLGDVAKKMNMRTHGLRNLTANLLGMRISKGAQCSNWARENLSTKQIVYAATDAWISRELYLRFVDLSIL